MLFITFSSLFVFHLHVVGTSLLNARLLLVLRWLILTWCVTPQSGNWVSTSLDNSGLCWTVFARNRDTAVPVEGNGDLQTLICVLMACSGRCLTLSNPVPWQNWMAAYLGYTLLMKALFCGWPIMVNNTHTRRRRLTTDYSEWYCRSLNILTTGSDGVFWVLSFD